MSERERLENLQILAAKGGDECACIEQRIDAKNAEATEKLKTELVKVQALLGGTITPERPADLREAILKTIKELER